MRISKKIITAGLFVSVFFCGLFLANVTAQTALTTDQQIELIRSNCISAKTTLNQLHSSDALLRVNVGQVYESMSAKLMENFNIRVASNGMNNTNLVSAVTNYGILLDGFRADYIIYEKQLSLAMAIDCSVKPVAFYDSVALARTKRVKIHDDILGLNQSLHQYRLSLDQFEIDNQVKLGGVKQ